MCSIEEEKSIKGIINELDKANSVALIEGRIVLSLKYQIYHVVGLLGSYQKP